MKKIFVFILAVCIAAAAFAQDTKPKSTLYGYFRLDFDYTKAMSAGKMYQAFTPGSLDLYDKKTDCIEAAYDFGIGTFVLQVGGNDDVDKQSVLIMPGLIITPDLGDMSLKAGANAQFVTAYETDGDTGIGAEIEVTKCLVVYPFVTLKNIGESNSEEMDWKFTLHFQWKLKYTF